MKKTKVLYWITTGLFSLFMLSAAIPDIISAKDAVEAFTKMNLPVYLLPFLGIAKALGVLAILIPGHTKIKEWAYTGLVIDLIGAAYCIAASGLPVSNWGFMVVPLFLAAVSYTFYHKKLKVTVSENQKSSSIPSFGASRKIGNEAVA